MPLKTLPNRVQSSPAKLQTHTTAVIRTRGRPWQRIRDQIMSRDFGICQACKRIGRMSLAHEIDHITPLSQGGTNHPSNLQALCVPCHEAKSDAEAKQRAGGYAKSRGM